ncbi:MAG: hypothetical protein R2857_05365 [Vampirovibrionales bacterium]
MTVGTQQRLQELNLKGVTSYDDFASFAQAMGANLENGTVVMLPIGKAVLRRP